MTFQTMKTLMTILLVAASSVLVMANDNELSNVTVKANYGRKVMVSIEDMHSAATIRLYSQNGALLTKVEAEAPAYVKQFDLSQLEAGTYSLAVEYGIREMTMPITIQSHQAYVDLGNREVYMKPIVRKANDRDRKSTRLNSSHYS